MAKARARTQARKVKDKWKAKQWYSLLAPPMFNNVVLAETLADEPDKLVGRVVTTTMHDLTGDFKQMHIKLDFQVHQVNGSNAESRFIGHSLTSDYVRRMIRRNHSKISMTVDVTTKDGAFLRVKPFAVTERRAQSSQQSEVRAIIQRVITDMAAERTLAAFVRDVLSGDVTATAYKASKKLYPLRRLEINKTEVRTAPAVFEEDDAKAFSTEPPAAEEEAPAEGEGEAGSEEEAPAIDEDAAAPEAPEEAEAEEDDVATEEEPPKPAAAEDAPQDAEKDAAEAQEPPAQART